MPRGERWWRYGAPAVLVLFLLLFPLFDRNTYHLTIAILIALYSMMAIGLNLLLGNTGQISLGQAAFYGIGAYTAAYLSAKVGLNFWWALAAGSAFSGLWGYIIGFSSLRLRGHYLAMATLGFGIIVSVVILEWTEVTGGPGGFSNIPRPSILGFRVDTEVEFFYLSWIVLGLLFYLTHNVVNSRVGRALAAVHESEVAAGVIGINPARYKLKVFVLSAVYAGIAGGIYAGFAGVIGPQSFSLFFSITLLCMVVIGGLGKVWGSIMGAAVLTLLPEVLRVIAEVEIMPRAAAKMLTEYSYHLIAYGILVIIFVIFFPGGLSAAVARIPEWIGAGESRQEVGKG